jgi:hypothetical protein
MRLGIIARCDNTGLGNQTRELVKMLNPSKILLIDSSSFGGGDQNHDWYDRYNCIVSHGFIKKDKNPIQKIGILIIKYFLIKIQVSWEVNII